MLRIDDTINEILNDVKKQKMVAEYIRDNNKLKSFPRAISFEGMKEIITMDKTSNNNVVIRGEELYGGDNVEASISKQELYHFFQLAQQNAAKIRPTPPPSPSTPTSPQAEQKTSPNISGKAQLCTDFDGTLTGLSGQQTFDTWFFKNRVFKSGGHLGSKYDTGACEDHSVLVARIKEEIEDIEKGQREGKEDIRMLPGAIDFLRNMLKQNSEVTIVSRNRTEYIQAMLEASGLTPDEVNKITIKDRRDLRLNYEGDKGNAVAELEGTKTGVRIVCDDDGKDYHSMTNALQGANKTVVGFNEGTGQFKWNEISQQVQHRMLMEERNEVLKKSLGGLHGSDYEQSCNYLSQKEIQPGSYVVRASRSLNTLLSVDIKLGDGHVYSHTIPESKQHEFPLNSPESSFFGRNVLRNKIEDFAKGCYEKDQRNFDKLQSLKSDLGRMERTVNGLLKMQVQHPEQHATKAQALQEVKDHFKAYKDGVQSNNILNMDSIIKSYTQLKESLQTLQKESQKFQIFTSKIGGEAKNVAYEITHSSTENIINPSSPEPPRSPRGGGRK